MDEVNGGYLKFLDKVEELRKIGREMQLTEKQIQECAQKALDTNLETDWNVQWKLFLKYLHEFVKYMIPVLITAMNTTKVNLRTLDKRWIRILVAIVIAIFIIIVIMLYQVIFEYEGPLGKLFVVLFEPYDCSIMKYARMLSLPLHGLFHIGAYHGLSCVVTNPWFREAVPENCWNIEAVNRTSVAITHNVTFPANILTKPIKFQNYSPYETTLQNITDMINENYEQLNHPSIILQSTVPWLKHAVDLVQMDNLEEKIIATPKFHMIWDSRRIITSQIIRKLFPRPTFLTKKSEIFIQRKLIIDGSGAEPFLLTDNSNGSILYMLSKGNRTLHFVAKPGCEHKGVPFQTVVEAGDLVVLPAIWDIYILTNGDEISIASVAYAGIK